MDALKKGVSSILSWFGSRTSKNAAFSLTADIVRLETIPDALKLRFS